MATDTAHQEWDETWKTEQGRANWIKPEPDVLSCATSLRLHGADTALDLGCGVGRHALAMAALGFETTAFDASEAGLAEAALQAQKRNLTLKTLKGSMTDLPFPDGSFDYVLSFNVIYHGDPDIVRTTVREVTRVLKGGGTFQGTMLSKRRQDFGRGVEVAPNTFVQPDGPGDKSHPHFFCNAAELIALLPDFEILALEDVDNNGDWHWHFVAQRIG